MAGRSNRTRFASGFCFAVDDETRRIPTILELPPALAKFEGAISRTKARVAAVHISHELVLELCLTFVESGFQLSDFFGEFLPPTLQVRAVSSPYFGCLCFNIFFGLLQLLPVV